VLPFSPQDGKRVRSFIPRGFFFRKKVLVPFSPFSFRTPLGGDISLAAFFFLRGRYRESKSPPQRKVAFPSFDVVRRPAPLLFLFPEHPPPSFSFLLFLPYGRGVTFGPTTDGSLSFFRKTSISSFPFACRAALLLLPRRTVPFSPG